MALIAVYHPPKAVSAVRVWDGSVGGEWHDPDEWTPAGGPYAWDDLTVNSGSAVTALPVNTDRDGSITIDGLGISTPSVDIRYLYVGRYETGTLEIRNQGELSTFRGHIAASAGSVGTAIVDGPPAFPTWWTWENADVMYVGESGKGTLDIGGGGRVVNGYGTFIGYGGDSDGAMTVADLGSLCSIRGRSLYVGYAGTGRLEIQNGARVGTVIHDVYLGHDAYSQGTATVTGTGSTLYVDRNLYVGYKAAGTLPNEISTLVVEDSGTVESNQGSIGVTGGSVGAATVEGPGSTWTNDNALYVGREGAGTLDVLDGGALSSFGGSVAVGSDAVGTVTVQGTGSTWTNGGFLILGNLGSGTMNVLEGAVVSNRDGWVGTLPLSNGRATVAGPGSQWINAGDLLVGGSGSGTLDVLSGAAVSSWDANVGGDPGSSGRVTVTGANSS